MRLLVVVLALLVAIPTDDAEACSCVARSFAEHAKTAKLVIVARAGTPVKNGDALKQPFTVLATLKGTASKQFLFDRPATPPCAANYADGELAILFTTSGDLSPCSGNVPIEAQVGELDKILDATGTKRAAAKAPVVEAALREALAKYTHDRPKIHVRYAPLDKTSFAIGKSTLAFTRQTHKVGVRISRAFATDSLALVEGTYNAEGVRFTVLLQLDGTWKVAWASVAES